MNYRVVWPRKPLDELAAARLAAADRDAVTASYQVDQNLATDPYGMGLPFGSPQMRTVSEPPLAVDYEIIEDDKKVRILRVWSAV